MVPPDQQNTGSLSAALEQRIRESPQIVVEYIRLARLLEESGDRQRAASVLQQAHFFLPNGPKIVADLHRLSEWTDPAPAPVTIGRPASSPRENPESIADVVEQAPEPEFHQADDLDELIEGLERGRMGRMGESVTAEELEWPVDEGLIATETLAHIYVAQKQFEEAVLVYDRLAEKESNPEKAAALRGKATELRAQLRDSS